MDIHTRIKQSREALGMSRQQLATLAGVTVQAVRAWELPEIKGNGDRKGTAPTRLRLKKVAEHLKVNAEWLLTGNDANLKLDGKYVFIPRYRRATEGTPPSMYTEDIQHLTDGIDSYAYRIDYLQKKGLIAAHCRVVEAPDDSMAIGTQLLVDITDKVIQPGKDYVLDSEAGIRVRKLFPRFDGMLILRADNPIFPEEVAPADALTIVGRVVGFTG